jgi:hypothetical protein
MSNWQIVILEPARQILAQIGNFLVNVLLVIIILLIGWLIAKVIKAVVTKVLSALKLDDLSDKIELTALLGKGGVTMALSELVGTICYWLALLVTFMVAINAIGLTIVADLLNKVILYIPNVIAAIFILILGMFVATLLRNIVEVAANNAGIAQSKILSKVVGAMITIFAAFVALEQLGIGIHMTELTLSIILGSVGLAVALAFGFGCQGIANDIAKDWLEKLKSKK